MVRDVVGEVWRLFRRRFWRTLVVVAILLAPLELGVALLDPDISSVAPSWWAWVLATSAVTLVAFPWAIGALVHDVAEGDPTPSDAYRHTWRRLPDLLISTVVTTVGILLATLAFVVPGLLLLARWALIVPLIVLEGAPWRTALSRSNQLVRGRTWPVVWIFVLLTLIGAALVAVPVVVGYVALQNFLGAWLATLALDTVLIAFFSFAPLVLYRRLTQGVDVRRRP